MATLVIAVLSMQPAAGGNGGILYSSRGYRLKEAGRERERTNQSTLSSAAADKRGAGCWERESTQVYNIPAGSGATTLSDKMQQAF